MTRLLPKNTCNASCLKALLTKKSGVGSAQHLHGSTFEKGGVRCATVASKRIREFPAGRVFGLHFGEIVHIPYSYSGLLCGNVTSVMVLRRIEPIGLS